jgi:flagellar biosynthesis/type III secretory pathway chaperone
MVMFLKDSLQLLKVLQEQLAECKKYLSVQREKTDTLVSGDIKKLDEIVKYEQSFVMLMESYEVKRNLILVKMGLGEYTISQIIDFYLAEDFKEEFSEVMHELTHTFENIKRVNFLNQRLLKQRLSVVNTILTNMAGEGAVILDNLKGEQNFERERINRV